MSRQSKRPSYLSSEPLSGQKLLSLARSPYENVDTTISTFRNAIRQLSIRGLLQGNLQIAEQLLQQQQQLQQTEGKKKKRKRKQATTGSGSPTCDAELILLACLRGLDYDTTTDAWLVHLAADTLTAALGYLQNNYATPTTLFLAEFELVAASAHAIATALWPHHAHACARRTATSLWSLMPHRWKKKQPWPQSTSCPRLYASLALVATVDMSVAEQWSRHVRDTTRALEYIVQRAVGYDGGNRGSLGTWDTTVHTVWEPQLRDSPRGAELLVQYVELLVDTMKALLRRETIGCGAAAATAVLQQLQTAHVDVESLVGVCESFVAFPEVIDGIYKRTKKRLRQEKIEGGLWLSPATLVGQPATEFGALGHDLLQTVLKTLGGMVVLPFSRRLLKLCYQSLLISSPLVLRSLIDPSSVISASSDHKKPKRPERLSCFAQCNALYSLEVLASTVGLDATKPETAKSITLLSGHIVSQLQGGGQDFSLTERRSVLEAGTRCLTQCLNYGGQFLRLDIRELIDSVAYTCFIAGCGNNHPLLAGQNNDMYSLLLELGIAVATTPHPDGASCDRTLIRAMVKLANLHPHLSASAKCRQVCSTISSPRLPALQIIATKGSPTSTNQPTDVATLLSRIAAAQQDYLRLHRPEPAPTHVVAPRDEQQENSIVGNSVLAENTVLAAESSTSKTVVVSNPVASKDSAEYAPKTAEKVLDDRSPITTEPGSVALPGNAKSINEDEDFDIPMIVDCGPDEDDVE